jgi:nitrogen-specific signal transduction histidine kinase
LHRRVEAEAVARTKAQADLFQLQKLEAIGQLTGGIAHDFNNLLMVIANGLQVLAQTNDPHQHKRALRRTQKASWRAAELTRRLLAFARRQALYPQRIELQQHIVSLRDLLFQGLKDDIRLHNDIAADIWPIEADVVALELALLNLAVNARDAMPDGGILTIAARNVPVEPAMATSRQLAPGDYVEISVRDTGIGMAPKLVAKVFEPFLTTKGAGNGTGLGLSQVHGFASQSGGTAWVQSRPNEGTTVRLLLPRSRRDLKPQLLSAQSQSSKTSAPLEVLVVEDDTSVASVVLEMIAALGHRGSCVPTVAAALTLLNNAGRIGLVLSDVLLPGGGSGLDLARELRQRRLGAPIILTSGYGGEMTQRLSAMNLPFLRSRIRVTRSPTRSASLCPPAGPRGRLKVSAGSAMASLAVLWDIAARVGERSNSPPHSGPSDQINWGNTVGGEGTLAPWSRPQLCMTDCGRAWLSDRIRPRKCTQLPG